MEKIEIAYARMEGLLENEKLFLFKEMTFRRMCLLMGVSPQEMDSFLEKETGFSGEQILLAFRMDWKERVKAEYNIVIDD